MPMPTISVMSEGLSPYCIAHDRAADLRAHGRLEDGDVGGFAVPRQHADIDQRNQQRGEHQL